MVIVYEITAGVCDYSCVNKEREINNIIACVSSILCIRDDFRPKSTQIQSIIFVHLNCWLQGKAIFPNKLPQS